MDITARTYEYKTDVVSQKQFDEHLKLYKGYIDKTNEISRKLVENPDLAGANAVYSSYRGLKKGESFALDGVILHELYFENMFVENMENGAISKIGQATQQAMNKYWGSVNNWMAAFVASATSARGWCMCVYEQRTDTYRNIAMDSHDDGLVCYSFPLIVLDMYEHAYFMDYGNNKAAYIHRFIERLPWSVIEKRFSSVMR